VSAAPITTPIATSVAPLSAKDKRAQVVARLNEEYALILLGSGSAVLQEGEDAEGAYEFRLLELNTFRHWLKPYVIYDQESGRKIEHSKIWLESEERRHYRGLVFDPSGQAPSTYYNLWTGFAVEPKAGPGYSCQRFLDHVAEVVCGGDEALFAWVMGWFASLIQRPAEKLGTAVVLHGGQGTGKSIVGEAVGSLLGRHYSKASDARFLTGRFNSHLANCLLFQLEEVTWGGDHAAAGKLKDLITSDWQMIEYKGKEPVKVQNYVRLFLTGNNEWMVPAGIDERRFCTIDVLDTHQQDGPYFAALRQELDHGGREALLDYLLRYDTRDIPLRQVPRTLALAEQQLASLAPHQQWWLDILRRGTLPGDVDGTGRVEADRLYAHYVAMLKDTYGIGRRMNEALFGKAIRKLAPGLCVKRPSVITAGGTERPRVYEFPSLERCREAFGRIAEAVEPSGTTETWQPDKRGAP
jgi:hypothetical protein